MVEREVSLLVWSGPIGCHCSALVHSFRAPLYSASLERNGFTNFKIQYNLSNKSSNCLFLWWWCPIFNRIAQHESDINICFAKIFHILSLPKIRTNFGKFFTPGKNLAE